MPSDQSLGFSQTVFSLWDLMVLLHERNVSSFPLCTHLSFSFLSLYVCSVQRVAKRTSFQLKRILCCFSKLTCKYSRNHSYCLYLMCSLFDVIRRRLDYRLNLNFCADLHLGRENWLFSLNGSRFNFILTVVWWQKGSSITMKTILLRIWLYQITVGLCGQTNLTYVDKQT